MNILPRTQTRSHPLPVYSHRIKLIVHARLYFTPSPSIAEGETRVGWQSPRILARMRVRTHYSRVRVAASSNDAAFP